MSLLKCPKCGEYFSDSYHICPFCAEDEEFYAGKMKKKANHRVEKTKAPSILGPALVLVVLLVVGVGLFTLLSGHDKEQPTEDVPQSDSAAPVAQLALDVNELTLEIGDEHTLTATGGEEITWVSSDEDVVTVNENGNVTAVGEGSATVTAVSGEQSVACAVTVNAEPEPEPEPAALEIETTYGSLNKNSSGNWEFTAAEGESFSLEVTGTDSAVAWSSSDEEVATVSEKGTFAAKGSGSATITAKVDGQTLKCDVRVN